MTLPKLRCLHPPYRLRIVDEGAVYCTECRTYLGTEMARRAYERMRGRVRSNILTRLWRRLWN